LHLRCTPQSLLPTRTDNPTVAVLGVTLITSVVPFVIHVICPLIIGGLLYLGWRPPTLLIHRLVRVAGFARTLDGLQSMAAALPRIPSLVALSLPDALWSYSLVAHFGRLWTRDEHRVSRVVWVSIAVAIAIGSELGQLAGFVPGVFDVVDLLCISVACTVAVLFLPRLGGVP
jgi:hypothetical protein